MSWENITSAFTRYSKISSYTPSTSPMTWDPKGKQLQWETYSKSVKQKSILLWHFNYILGVHIAYTSSIVYFVVQQLYGYGPKREFMNVVILLIRAILNWIGSVMHIMIILYGREAVHGWNGVRAVEAILTSSMGK